MGSGVAFQFVFCAERQVADSASVYFWLSLCCHVDHAEDEPYYEAVHDAVCDGDDEKPSWDSEYWIVCHRYVQ